VRLKHDYAVWHEDRDKAALAATGNRLPFSRRWDKKNPAPENERIGSKFDSAKIIEDAIAKSDEFPAVASRGNYVVTFDMGYEVGFDEVAERRTSTVTVVLSHEVPKDEWIVVTAYPGSPYSRKPK
jgi:hypothetical protein